MRNLSQTCNSESSLLCLCDKINIYFRVSVECCRGVYCKVLFWNDCVHSKPNGIRILTIYIVLYVNNGTITPFITMTLPAPAGPTTAPRTLSRHSLAWMTLEIWRLHLNFYRYSHFFCYFPF